MARAATKGLKARLGWGALGLATAMAPAALAPAALAGGGGVSITSYGHSALLIQGGGASVLVNPFKAVACAAGLA